MKFSRRFPRSSIRRAALVVGLSATATAATAQTSSVRLYGTVDLSAAQNQLSGAPRKVKALNSGAMQTSYWGVGGTEDLGSGYSAVFALESFMRDDTGESGRFGGDPFFARNAYVGMGTPLGVVRAGRIGTPLFATVLGYNPLYSSFGYSPAIRTWFNAPGRISGDTAWNNAVAYYTPATLLQNFGATVMRSAGEGGNAGGNAGGNLGGNVEYNDRTFGVALAGQKVKTAFSTGNQSAWDAAAFYDFKFVKISGQYGKVHETTTNVAARNTADTIYNAGLSVPISTGNLIAEWGRARTSGTQNLTREVDTVGYDYFLSKRTDIYAMLMREKVTSLSTGVNYGIGLRHAF